MQIHMNFLRHANNDFLTSLRDDGWVIFAENGEKEIDVIHPQVTNEDAARVRLHSLGMLTSGAVRIEFCPCCQDFTQTK